MLNHLKPSYIFSSIILTILILPFLILFKEAIFINNISSEVIAPLLSYANNSLTQILYSLILASFFGISLALITSFYEFRAKKIINILILLPLAIPAYILAIIYGYISEEQLPYLCLKFFSESCNFSMRNILGSSFIFALSLYPYIYLFCKSYFHKISDRYMLGKIYGFNNFKIFRKIILPSSSPAIISALIIITMEIIADFGVSSLYGIETFTTEIYRYWFFKNDYSFAVLLSSSLLIFILIILALEKFLKGNKTHQLNSQTAAPLSATKVTGLKEIMIIIFCLSITVFGFLIPFSQILFWSFEHYEQIFATKFLRSFANSAFLAILGTIIITVITLILLVNSKLSNSHLKNFCLNIISLGYAIPGSVIAIAVIYALNFIAKQFSLSYEFITSFSIIGLLYAYQIRFTSLAFNNLKIAWFKIPDELINISLIYKKNNFSRTSKIYAPLLSQGVFIASLLIAIEIIKELPATLILRPFNFDTLATRAYMLASDEMVIESGIASLTIILINLIPIYFLNKIFNHEQINSK